MEINDSFIRELVSILNEVSIEKGSNNRFRSNASVLDYGVEYPEETMVEYSILYTNKETNEDMSFLRLRGNLSDEDLLDTFKYQLIKNIVLLKDNMTSTKQTKSMRTLVSKPSVENKIFNKFEKNLELDEYENEL